MCLEWIWKNTMALTCCQEMFKAYAAITGHEVTYANRQPIWKITTCKRAFEAYSGYHGGTTSSSSVGISKIRAWGKTRN